MLLEGVSASPKDGVVRTGGIPPHPLFLTDVHVQNTNERDRQDFLREIACFRPKETVFEAFASATGKKTNSGVISHIDRGRTTTAKLKAGESSSLALLAMKDMRRQMRIVRDNGSLVVAGSTSSGDPAREASTDDNGEDEDLDNSEEALEDDSNHDNNSMPANTATTNVIMESKRRLSKAERRRAKKNPDPKLAVSADSFHATTTTMDGPGTVKRKVVKRGAANFCDPGYYMANDYSTSNTTDDEAQQI